MILNFSKSGGAGAACVAKARAPPVDAAARA